MSTDSVLAAARVTLGLGDAGPAKPPELSVSVSLTSTVFERIPVVVAGAEDLGAGQDWPPGQPVSYPLEVTAFPARELAEALALHLTLTGPRDWAQPGTELAVDLELSFDGAAAPARWTPPRMTVDVAAGPSHRLPLPTLSVS
jgi:hypothetical protein